MNSETPLRICFCNSAQTWGGGELWHLSFATQLRKHGFVPHLLATRGSALEQRARQTELPCMSLPLGRLSFLNPLRMLQLWRFFKHLAPHVVVLGLPQDLKAAGQAARAAGCPLVLYRRGMGLPVRNSAFNRHLYRNVAHGVIVNARDTRRALLAENPDLLPHERIHLLPNGVDDSLLSRKPARPPEASPCVIGTAGRLVEQKGQRYLLKAAALLRQRGLVFELHIAGDGPLRAELQNLAAVLQIEDITHFQGFVQDMSSFYDSLHVFAFPSLWEGMGNAVLEAMAAARPVVGFAVSSMPEVVRQEATGLLVPERDVEALAQALERLIQAPGLRAQYGAAGRQRVRQEFLLSHQLRRFENLVRSKLAH